MGVGSTSENGHFSVNLSCNLSCILANLSCWATGMRGSGPAKCPDSSIPETGLSSDGEGVWEAEYRLGGISAE